jgi:hypothetical protein
MKKQELVDAIHDGLNDRELLASSVGACNDEEIELFESVMRKGKTRYRGRDALDAYRLIEKTGAFMGLYGNNGALVLVAPDETKAMYETIDTPEFHCKRRRYINIGLYATALVNLCGFVCSEDIARIYNSQNDDRIESDELNKMLFRHILRSEYDYALYEDGICHATLAYGEAPKENVEFIDEEEFASDKEFVSDGEIDDDEEDYLSYLVDRHATIPMREMEKEELLRYADEEYYEFTRAHKRLYAFLKAHLPENCEEPILALLTVKDLHRAAQMDCEPSYILDALEEYGFSSEKSPMDIETVNQVLVLASDVMNDTRHWSNNGWTPNELVEKQHRAKRFGKIGRNDPCPCGSGKKYKKCCGKPAPDPLLN